MKGGLVVKDFQKMRAAQSRFDVTNFFDTFQKVSALQLVTTASSKDHRFICIAFSEFYDTHKVILGIFGMTSKLLPFVPIQSHLDANIVLKMQIFDVDGNFLLV